ncbi:hypothetical protein F2Q68_00031947 [Brassica cretica]|uniref:Uncharacterized protein n=1 Tax=Brassica cretica TaxID=69181 RepID=A0A8S9G7L6_BRACR|nr:hypothetical protein F2Q68_00031947 [Brassica cretica]
MELERIHNGGVGVGALQRCEPGAHGVGCHRSSDKKNKIFVCLNVLRRNSLSSMETHLGVGKRKSTEHVT